MADETAAKEAVNTALMAVQAEYTDLERAVVSVCQELEGEGAVSGSSVISRLRALGGRITEHAKRTFRLGVLRALAVSLTHYIWTSRGCHRGTSFPTTPMRTPRRPSWTKPTQPRRSSSQSSPRSSKPTSLPLLNSTPLKTRKGGMVACRKSGPRSPCNRLVNIS